MYDFIDRTTSIVSSNGLKQTYSYDNKNRIESYTSTIGSISQKTGFLYGKDTTFGINLQKPGYLYGVTLNGSQTLAYEYDSLSRMTTRRIDGANHYKTTYEYYQGPNNEGTSQTTTMLSSVTNGETCWDYTYDALGNITSIRKDGVVQESYTYDNLNQLKTVTRGSDVWEYSYDNGGNLTAVKQNGTVIKNYQYGDSEWKDLLTSYNNQNLTYDTIGNPLQYRDGYNFTWQNGRQLASITKGTDTISYAYNSDGLRTSKTVNGTTTEYYWLEGSLLGEKTGNEYIIYLYDDNGSAYGIMITDGTEETYYYYLFNSQGDIIGIVDSNGNQVVEYTYNAWGEIISITGTEADTIGQKNPLKYRGYYYDEETGFYYVSSRYYDPGIERFINADGYVSTGQNINSCNMFAYCGNNPVNRIDPAGMFWSSIKNIISKTWNNVKTWAKNTFGAGATSSHQTKQETELLPVILNLAVTIKTGTKENKTISQIGDSSKPLSVYANGRSDNFMASSVGAKVNISNVSIDASLGLEDIGISIVKKSGDLEKAYGITMDATQFKVGFEWSTSTIVQWDNNTTLTNYTNVSITAAGVLALYAVMTGQLQNLKQLQPTN